MGRNHVKLATRAGHIYPVNTQPNPRGMNLRVSVLKLRTKLVVVYTCLLDSNPVRAVICTSAQKIILVEGNLRSCIGSKGLVRCSLHRSIREL